MEKIYEQNQNNQNNKNRKQIKLDGTTILSFAVALFAIVSLVTVGFNQISYAAPTDVEDYPESFTLEAFEGKARILGDVSRYSVTPYYAILDDGTRKTVYCMERDLDPFGGSKYNKEMNAKLDDKGLLYLLANLKPNKKLYRAADKTNPINDEAQIWISQTAIWIYLAETKAANNNVLTPEIITSIKSETSLYSSAGSPTDYLITGTEKLYDSVISENGMTINQLIEKAKSFKGTEAATLEITKNNEVSVSKDGKFYITKPITVNGSIDQSIGSYKGYKLNIVKAPEGTKVINKDGVELKDEELEAMTISEFFLKIPVDKVKEENKVVQLTATGSFEYLTGYGYRAADAADGKKAQQLAIVQKAPDTKNVPIELEINYTPDVPDTGMTTAQSIYFIGLVVLLCGVGIIYANTQPATNKQ